MFRIICCLTAVGVSSSLDLGRRAGLKTEDGNPHLRIIASPDVTQQGKTSSREHIIRHIYGDHNALVRKEIAAIEERIPRYTTGLPEDPSHIVSYNNHPFDPEVRRRMQSTNTTDTQSNFQPIRMAVETKALDDVRDASNAAKIDWFKTVVMPKAVGFWASTLSVIPVQGNLRITSGDLSGFTYCGDSEFSQVPNEHKSNGVANADLILYVSASSSTRFCPDRTLAVATPCNFDQFDRPTAGAINVCLGSIVLNADGTASSDVLEDYVDVTIHEMGHVLGHSSNSYRFFWDPDTGMPRTSRPFQERTVLCVDGSTKSLILPDSNTLDFVTKSDGRQYAAIVTPKVKTIARNQFNCQSLIGAYLENQPTRAESCTGDHWDERFFYPEAMSGIISPTTNILSSLTLALMEDSGWYLANYTNSRMSPWGLGSGCDFVEKPCLTPNSLDEATVPDYSAGFFCNEGAVKSCSPEHTHKLACQVLDYQFYGTELPDEVHQYFPDEPTKGGPRQADYCPVYGQTYDNLKASELDCTNPSNTPTINVYSEVYGQESQCIPSSAGEGLCYRTACIRDDMSLRINVLGEWIRCASDFESHTISVGQGFVKTTIFCPRLSQVCPDLFCPFNCAGRGECNYENEINGTKFPICECFDSTDTSAACSDSQVPDGGFLQNAGGLLDNLEENFFDPLIKVFVDHPDAWTTASWAWAAGLLVIFFILLLCICSSVIPQRPRKI